MRRRKAWPAASVLVTLASCAPAHDEPLPQVKGAPASLATCSPAEYGKVATEAHLGAHSTLDTCVQSAWDTSCEGSLSFAVDVDASGATGGLRFEGNESKHLRRCVAQEVARAVLVPAADCRGAHVASTVRGSIRWRSNGGTGVSFADESGVITCLRDCPLERAARGGTKGCG